MLRNLKTENSLRFGDYLSIRFQVKKVPLLQGPLGKANLHRSTSSEKNGSPKL
jgi:hypothetical protein